MLQGFLGISQVNISMEGASTSESGHLFINFDNTPAPVNISWTSLTFFLFFVYVIFYCVGR